MELTTAAVVIGLVLVASFQQTFGLNCWECDTRDYFECADGDELPSATYRHCDDEFGGPPVCIKVVSHTFGVRRQCINDFLQASRICESARDFDNTVNCQICSYDGCNSATSSGPIAVLIALPIVLMKLFCA